MSDRVYVCIVCGHTLTEEEFNAMPDDYLCPDCGVCKEDYILMD